MLHLEIKYGQKVKMAYSPIFHHELSGTIRKRAELDVLDSKTPVLGVSVVLLRTVIHVGTLVVR